MVAGARTLGRRRRRERGRAVGRELLQTGDLDKGIFWAGMVQGLIHDIPTVKELIDRIISEAEEIVGRRLAGMYVGGKINEVKSGSSNDV